MKDFEPKLIDPPRFGRHLLLSLVNSKGGQQTFLLSFPSQAREAGIQAGPHGAMTCGVDIRREDDPRNHESGDAAADRHRPDDNARYHHEQPHLLCVNLVEQDPPSDAEDGREDPTGEWIRDRECGQSGEEVVSWPGIAELDDLDDRPGDGVRSRAEEETGGYPNPFDELPRLPTKKGKNNRPRWKTGVLKPDQAD